MNKKLFVFLPFLLFLVGTFTACDEVDEPGKYDNWQKRNDTFVDSLKALKPTVIPDNNSEGAVDKAFAGISNGTLFAIKVPRASKQNDTQYIYCKKIVSNTDGDRPVYTQYVNVYYYGTLITGDRFDGNFIGYSTLDKTFTGEKNPTAFDSFTQFRVMNGLAGWTEALQYMRQGERWMLYIPYQSGYGTSASGSIPGYSMLTFDVILKEVIK